MNLYATDLQIYIGLQYLEKMASEENRFLLVLKRKDQLEEICMGTKFSPDVKDLTNTISTFGTAVTQSSPTTLQLKTSREYQANIPVPPTLTIDKITTTLKTILQIPTQDVTLGIFGCQIFTDGKILILDKVSIKLLLFSKDGEYTETVIIFKDEPNDICYIKGNLIAVLFHAVHKLFLIDLLTKRITKTIQLVD